MPGAGWVGLPSVERAQVDRFKAITTIGDAVGDVGEGPRVGWPLPLSRPENVDLDGAVLEACRDDREGPHVDVVDAGLSVKRDGIDELDPQRQRPDTSVGTTVTERSSDPSGNLVRSCVVGRDGDVQRLQPQPGPA